jgi:NADP-dependent 3-hydroxy acid dehydrogenase YdfG
MIRDDTLSLRGQRVLITGGTTGVGRAVAELLGAEGCRVFIGGSDPEHLRQALEGIRETCRDVNGATSDIGTVEGVREFFGAAEEWLGGVDIVILCAGIGANGELSKQSHEECRQLVNVNLLSVIHGSLEAVRRMQRRRGQIVMIGSLSAEVFDPNAAVYTATKAGVRGFAGSLRKELNPHGIRVSLIEPGSIGTEMVDESAAEQQRMQEEMKMLRADDVARAILFVLTQPERSDVIHLQVRPHLQIV